MSLYPDAAGLVQDPVQWQRRFKTSVGGPYGNENVVTRAGIQFPLHQATIRYYLVGWNPYIRAVMEFFNDRRGRYESFTFYDVNGWDAVPAGLAYGTYGPPTKGPVYVATQVAGGTTTFDIPARYVDQATLNADASKHMLVNGAGVTVTSWTWNTGVDGRTRVVLAAAPALGDVISCTFTARRVWKCLFGADTLDPEWQSSDFYSLSVQLVEVP